jgi:DNA helicase HerA-like ATPase
MLDKELQAICKKLKPILGKRADTLWLAYLTAETPDSKREAEALIQMFASRYLGSAVDDNAILLPPPSQEAASGEFFLGTVHYGAESLFPLFLRPENFVRHVGIYSITGGGKTNVAQLLLLGLLRTGKPWMVLDWKRAYRGLLSLPTSEVAKIQIYSVGRKTASPFHWNPLRGPPGVHPRTWISTVAEALEKSHLSGPGVADILIEILDRKFEEAGVYESKDAKLPNFFDALEALDRLQFKGRKMLWQDSASRILKTFTFGPSQAPEGVLERCPPPLDPSVPLGPG